MDGKLELSKSSVCYTIYTRQNNEINFYGRNNIVMKVNGNTKAVLSYNSELMNKYNITLSDIKNTIDDYEYKKHLIQQKIDSFNIRKNAIADKMSAYADVNKVIAYIDMAYKDEFGFILDQMWLNSTDNQIIESAKIALQMENSIF